MDDFGGIFKTGGKFLKLYIWIHILWQVVSILLLLGVVIGIVALLIQSKSLLMIFGI